MLNNVLGRMNNNFFGVFFHTARAGKIPPYLALALSIFIFTLAFSKHTGYTTLLQLIP